MSEGMSELEILLQERNKSGTSWTNNETFDKNGYLFVKNLWNPEELYHPVPDQKGQYNYYGKTVEEFNHVPVERQVEGSTSRYWHPQYRYVHTGIRLKLEKLIGRKLYNTYYYDRFYFPGQELTKHTDRDACEISVTVHVSTNLEGKDADWPICIKTPDVYADETRQQILIPGENHAVILEPGDGVIYKGCERPHWREPMPTPKQKKKWFGKSEKREYYYHQIFFHYVLQDGMRAECAWDRG